MNTNSTDFTANELPASGGKAASDSSPARGGSADKPGFAPSHSELYQLAKHWNRQLLGATFYSWAKGSLAPNEPALFLKLWNYGQARLEAIGSVLGTDVVNNTHDEVRGELGLRYGSAWDAFDNSCTENLPRDANERVILSGFVLPSRETLVDPDSLIEANLL